MPYSKTQVCNMALAHVGVAATISDVDTETSTEAENCRLFYDHCRDVLLQAKPWGFATEQVTLSKLTGTPPSGWAYWYMYPNFCVRANFIVNPATRIPTREQKIPFKVVRVPTASGYGKAILTDQDGAILEFNRGITDENVFSPTFVQALSLFLATHISQPLRVNANITKLTQELFSVWNSEAAALDMAEAQDDAEQQSQFVNARG